MIASKSNKINLISKCGHIANNISLSEFVKCKIQVYCRNCINSGKFSERECVVCGIAFKAARVNQHFCSMKCSCAKDYTEKAKTSYDELKEFVENKGCKLLTSKEQYISLKGEKIVDIMSSCGHQTKNCTVRKLKSRGTGIKCKMCVTDDMKFNAIQRLKNNDNSTQKTENKSYVFIKSLIDKTFDVERTGECCLADVMIKPKSEEKNMWLPIQLKSTSIISNVHTFHLNNTYTDMIVLLHSLMDNKFWCIDGSSLKNINKFTLD